MLQYIVCIMQYIDYIKKGISYIFLMSCFHLFKYKKEDQMNKAIWSSTPITILFFRTRFLTSD